MTIMGKVDTICQFSDVYLRRVAESGDEWVLLILRYIA